MILCFVSKCPLFFRCTLYKSKMLCPLVFLLQWMIYLFIFTHWIQTTNWSNISVCFTRSNKSNKDSPTCIWWVCLCTCFHGSLWTKILVNLTNCLHSAFFSSSSTWQLWCKALDDACCGINQTIPNCFLYFISVLLYFFSTFIPSILFSK